MKSKPVNKYFSGVKRHICVLVLILFIDVGNALRKSDFDMKNKMEMNRREPTCG